MPSLKQEKTSAGKSIENSPNHVFASFGFTCRRQIIFWCIFLNALATMCLEGNSCCTFSNRDCSLNLASKVWAALSSSLKKPFTCLIPSPVETSSKHLLFTLRRAGGSGSVNLSFADFLDFLFTYPFYLGCFIENSMCTNFFLEDTREGLK